MQFSRSPINYMGGKFRSLKNIIPNFPNYINTFYDLFSGSGTIHLNTFAENVVVNDINYIVVDLQEFISSSDPEKLYNNLLHMARSYKLYESNSDGYIELRKEYNFDKDPLKLLALSQHSFNYLIRFNKKGEFNASHGKGISKLSNDFLNKLIYFNEYTSNSNYTFMSKDFRKVVNLNKLNKNDLVYCDPPYLLSEAVYNEKRAFGGWTRKDSLELFNLLDDIHNEGSNFALTEMIFSKGMTNTDLTKWVSKNNYTIRYNNVKYLGVPSTHNNDKSSVEVLVTNY